MPLLSKVTGPWEGVGLLGSHDLDGGGDLGGGNVGEEGVGEGCR